MTSRQPTVSFIMATHGRREVVSRTLDSLAQCGWPASARQTIVVDNDSRDGTPGAIASRVDHLIRLPRNAGSCAKAYGVKRAEGRFVVFLDDDSFPRPGSIERMVEHFEADSRLGAAGFSVHLPDGRLEGAALPGVFVGCGVGFRADALRQVGGLDPAFFMQAEEYDLSFRLVAGGWKVEVFDDLHVEHLKAPQARKSERTTYYDIRNNLRVVARYLPDPYHEVYRADWVQRYSWLAQRAGHGRTFRRGLEAGGLDAVIDRSTHADARLADEALEFFFSWEFVRSKMEALARQGVRRIVLADLGKNVYAFRRGAELADLEVLAIADDRFAAPDRLYRGVPVTAAHDALAQWPDAIVVANSGRVHADATALRLATLTSVPIENWFGRSIAVGSAARDMCVAGHSIEDSTGRASSRRSRRSVIRSK